MASLRNGWGVFGRDLRRRSPRGLQPGQPTNPNPICSHEVCNMKLHFPASLSQLLGCCSIFRETAKACAYLLFSLACLRNSAFYAETSRGGRSYCGSTSQVWWQVFLGLTVGPFSLCAVVTETLRGNSGGASFLCRCSRLPLFPATLECRKVLFTIESGMRMVSMPPQTRPKPRNQKYLPERARVAEQAGLHTSRYSAIES